MAGYGKEMAMSGVGARGSTWEHGGAHGSTWWGLKEGKSVHYRLDGTREMVANV